MKAFIAVVVKRSNSRNCGATADDVVTNASGDFFHYDFLGSVFMHRISNKRRENKRRSIYAGIGQLARRTTNVLLV